MSNTIVTTTIHSPTLALERYAAMPDWDLIVVGDKKTPHADYDGFGRYIHPDEQQDKYPALSDEIGWNSIQRRNIGFIEAYKSGAKVVATVDDDNIPYSDWGKDLLIGKKVDVDVWNNTSVNVFDPLSVTNHPELWHRGYPIEYVPFRREVEYLGKKTRGVLFQASLWDGDPDVDAMVRLSQKPVVKFDSIKPYGSDQIVPFNSQNTFIEASALPWYCVFPHVGRMDDIWGAYVAQAFLPRTVAFTSASVYQDRNVQDLVKNLENEIIGYRETLRVVQTASLGTGANLITKLLESLGVRRFWELYREAING